MKEVTIAGAMARRIDRKIVQTETTKPNLFMPVLSKFYGIVIRMLCARQFDARFHAIYENSELVVRIWPLAIVQGEAPRRVREMVLEWAAQHQQELLSAWHRCTFGQPPLRIAPLQ